MSLFRAIRDIVRSDDRSVAVDDRSAMDFPSIDVEKLKVALQLDNKGAARGGQNEPPSQASVYDEVELEIVAAMTTLRDEAYDTFSKQMAVYDGRLARLDLRTLTPEIKTALSGAEANFSATVQKDAGYVSDAQGQLLEARAALREFRAENKLRRLPRQPSNAVLSFGVLAILFLVETAANSSFFSATHPGGLLGAGFEAAVISVVNIVVGFVVGYFCLRYILIPRIGWRLLSATVLIGLLGSAVVFNFAAAHYRDAFLLVPPDADSFMSKASDLALNRLLDLRHQLSGFQSYLMVALGLLILLGAAYKGYTWTDPFPGYARESNRVRERTRSYLRMIDSFVEQLQARNADALGDIQSSIIEIRQRDEEYGTVAAQRVRLVQKFNGYVESLQRTGDVLLQTYRAANRAARTTPPPEVFSQPWKPAWLKEDLATDGTLAERKQTVRDLLDEIRASQERLLVVFHGALANYKKLRDVAKQESTNGAA